MRLVDISPATESIFATCLHVELPEDPKLSAGRKAWHAAYKDKGYKAQVLMGEGDAVLGKCQTIPIEHSPFTGHDLLAILCIYVHLYRHYVGDQRGQGYGRFMLESIERDALARGFKGVVTWGMDWDIWNPISFFEHVGYTRADQDGLVIAAWKPFSPDAEPPSLMRLPGLPPGRGDKVQVFLADNLWCDSDEKKLAVQEAIKGIEHLVDYSEAGPPCCDRILHVGNVGGIFLDGKPYRPYEEIGAIADLRAEIMRLAAAKGL